MNQKLVRGIALGIAAIMVLSIVISSILGNAF